MIDAMLFLSALDDCSVDPLMTPLGVCSMPAPSQPAHPCQQQQIHIGPGSCLADLYATPESPNPLAALQSLVNQADTTPSTTNSLNMGRREALDRPVSVCVPTSRCRACGGQIKDRHFLLIGGTEAYHESCVKCAQCQEQLSSGSCYIRDQALWCRRDYMLRYGQGQCQRCQARIVSGGFYMRARNFLFHPDCFVCALCSRPLKTGERFVFVENGLLYCDAHSDPSFFYMAPPMYGSLDPSAQSQPSTSRISQPRPGRQRGRRSTAAASTDGDANGAGGFYESADGAEETSANGAQPKAKRMRTSFKHHQLKAMKTYFGLNHNPDAKDLKQLANKTGLTKRVLQVWFQNARAKERRLQNNKEPNGNDDYNMGMTDTSYDEADLMALCTAEESLGSLSPEARSDDSGAGIITSNPDCL